MIILHAINIQRLNEQILQYYSENIPQSKKYKEWLLENNYSEI